MRTIIEIPEECVQALDHLRSQENTSRAALIRSAIEDYLRAHEKPRLQDLPAFGLWKGRKVDGVKYQRRLRREWPR